MRTPTSRDRARGSRKGSSFSRTFSIPIGSTGPTSIGRGRRWIRASPPSYLECDVAHEEGDASERRIVELVRVVRRLVVVIVPSSEEGNRRNAAMTEIRVIRALVGFLLGIPFLQSGVA